MYDLLILVGLSLIAASFMLRMQRKQGRPRDEVSDKPTPAPIQQRVEMPALDRGANDDSLRAVPRDSRFAFVSSFGVRPDKLRELHVYTCMGRMEQFPEKVEALLRKLYANGHAVGTEMMALVNHGRVLAEGEAIYVAVERDERSNRDRTIAFLDRHRSC